MQHMKSEHPDFSTVQTLKTIRVAFGMTQHDIAKESNVDSTQVSLYERGKHVAPYAKKRLDHWLERHQVNTLRDEISKETT